MTEVVRGPDEPTRHAGPRVEWELRIWGDGDVVQGGRCPAGALAKILRQHADELAQRSEPVPVLDVRRKPGESDG